jgi:putative nucleotidyltransferase with HDIG domain
MERTSSGVAGRRPIRRGSMERVVEIAKELDLRDQGTARHCQTVACYAEAIARELELAEDVVESVRLAGLLHDVGKIGIPGSIVAKPGPLDDAEWIEMQNHPRIGASILEDAGLEDIREWILAHHERPDGRGYPRGLSDDEIPLEAKILAVADAYEAMTNDRCYRTSIGRVRALDELRRHAGSQFDESVVEAFVTVLDLDETGSAPNGEL